MFRKTSSTDSKIWQLVLITLSLSLTACKILRECCTSLLPGNFRPVSCVKGYEQRQPFNFPKRNIRRPSKGKLFVLLLLSAGFHLWCFSSFQSYPLYWLSSKIRSTEVVDSRIYKNCSTVDWQKRFAVVVPLVAKQTSRVLGNLKRWTLPEYFPCDAQLDAAARMNSDLIFYYDLKLEEKSVDESIHSLAEALVQEPLRSVLTQCFGNIRFISANLSAEETKNSYKMDFLKSSVKTEGTVRQFYRSISHPSLISSYRHFFYMEPDHIPIRSRWLAAVYNESLCGDFWMKGSLMRYKPKFSIAFEPYRTQYLRHINGNAIYKVGDPCFVHFLQNVYEEYPGLAFDTSINFYRLDLRHYSTYQYTAQRFQVTDVMADLGVTKYDEHELQEELPNTYTAHGKFMFIENGFGWQKY
eukprot:jgi/Galph1/5576/GphlegSOOS_G4287.1